MVWQGRCIILADNDFKDLCVGVGDSYVSYISCDKVVNKIISLHFVKNLISSIRWK